ncbi:TPA: hypothetical protein ACTYTR_004402 [Klebsiella michiganensis]|uniref:hypothetical protein n=1 Tax=Klebsiella TaxID=570 RepID=UPI000ADE420D|nr:MULTISPECIES: hypothetical protein [Klebsiella]MDM4122143.1 hypothetical protein [Klebsiella michiganensis]MDM4159031.1 hypothetical protein [Klebsiella michiganensis]MDS7752200.1 hypothetical protein [Klebsiella michiganensis]
MTTDITELLQREKFEAWVMTQICISKSTLEGLRTADGYRNTTLSGTDYNRMWNCWKAAGAELVEALEKAQQPVVPPMQHWEELCREHPDMSIGDAIIRAAWWNHCRAAMLQAGNFPVIPDGYVMVPMTLTAENGAKGALSGEFSETKFVNCPECFGDDECETCDGSGRIEITVPVTWTTIKEIWAKGVEHFAAAPQEVPDGK